MAGIADVLSFLFGGSGGGNAADDALIATTTEAIVDQVEPRLRMIAGYQKKVAGGVRKTLAHLRALRDELPQDTMLLSRAQWGRDPRVNAFFARADDVPDFLGRSRPLRAVFKADPGVVEAFALLAMKLEERKILAPKLVGNELRQEVAQTAVSFTKHTLFGPAPTLAQMRLQVGKQLFMRIAQVALKRIIEADERAVDLQQRKGYLATRLRLLHLAKDGIEGIVEDPARIDAEIRSIEAELKQTVDQFIEVKSSVATLDQQCNRINDVLLHPEHHLRLVHEPIRINRLGIKLEPGESDPNANDLVLDQLVLGALTVVIALVRCPRGDLPPEEDLVAKAERYL
jgi:hypothetical protein